MELTAYELALIAGGFGIAGTLLGVLGAYRLSIKLAYRQFEHLREVSRLDAWHASAREFVASFSDELAILDAEEELSIRLDEYLLRAYDAKHKSAIATFEHFVHEGSLASFKATCKEYHSSAKSEEMIETGMSVREAMFIEYMGHPFYHPQLTPYQLAAERIRAMLAFAKARQSHVCNYMGT